VWEIFRTLNVNAGYKHSNHFALKVKRKHTKSSHSTGFVNICFDLLYRLMYAD